MKFFIFSLILYTGALIYKHLPIPRKVMYTDKILKMNQHWTVVIGKSNHHWIGHNFESIPHLLIGGMTRYGKTVALKNIINGLLYSKPDQVEFILIDLKGMLAMQRYEHIKQTSYTAGTVEEALKVLREVENMIKRRLLWFRSKGWESVQDAFFVKRVFVVIDEAAALSSSGKQGEEKKDAIECERILSYIAQQGGGLGFRLIFCTQYPTADIVPRQVKMNCDATLAFKCRNVTSSKVLLDEAGAEEIPVGYRGRAIYQSDYNIEVQVPYMEDDSHIIDKHKEVLDVDYEERETEGRNPANDRQIGLPFT